jgi:Putative beta-barrel porin-2, OmpL-like. bbp2
LIIQWAKPKLFAGAVLLMTCCGCMAQAPVKGMGEMTGRDDSGADRKFFAIGKYPEDQRPFLTDHPFTTWTREHRIRSFGWLDGGVSSMSNASGLVREAPTPNRFSNQLMLNSAWLAVERTRTLHLSWGFRADFFAGSDAALLRSQDHFGLLGPRWGTDFRQAYFSLHAPALFRKGIDLTAGRINFPTGTETELSPYQPLYSRSYFWIHGATSGTALFATLHATPQVDAVVGTTMGYGTTFILRGRAPSYLARVLFHPETRLKQQFLVTVYTGPKPLAAAPGHTGSWQTLGELQAREVWTDHFTQIFDVNYTADANDPANAGHNSGSQDAFVLTAYTLSRAATLQTRAEWFADPHGARAATPGTYGEATAGMTLHLKPWLEFRPEIRGDFSGQKSFGAEDSSLRHRNQLSTGFELLFKGRLL